MSKARELASLGNAYSDGALSNRNLIINGKHAINQRGQLPTSMITGYNCTDRWKTYTNTSVSNSLSEVTLPNGDTVNALKGVSNATTTAVISFYQVVENDNYRAFAGQTMTASCWVRSNNTNARLFMWGNSSNVGSVTHSGNGQWEKLTVTFTLPSNPVQLELYAAIGDNGSLSAVSVLSGDYVEFTEVQLEVGDTATPFEHRSYGQELALCQRYYQKIGGPAYTGIAHGINFAGPQAVRAANIYYISEMRAAPSVVIVGTLIATDRTGFDTDVSSLLSWSAGTASASAQFSKAAVSGSDYSVVQIAVKNGTTSYLTLDAEL